MFDVHLLLGFVDTQFSNESYAGIEMLLRSDNFHNI